MSNVSYAGSTALASAMQGMERASGKLEDSASQVLEATVRVNSDGTGGSTDGDTVSISDEAFSGMSLEKGLLDSRIASFTYEANTQVVRSSDEAFSALLDVVVGP